MSFVKIATVGEIPENSARAFEFEGERIAIYNCGGRFYAIANICTHAYAELHEGFFDTDDCSIECPLHGARFSIETGAVLALPAYQPLQTYEVKIDGQDVLIDI
ncbi:MAG: bifunctional 3-phenylpropionate/cinnamic acid dioxygenase ferredoxin subunit [Roseiflexaceae bacterium]